MKKSPKNLTDRELLESLYRLQQEDHEKIVKIHKRIKIQFVANILKWILYIGIAVGLYTFIQPYIENSIGIYQDLKSGAENLSEIRNDLLNFPFLR